MNKKKMPIGIFDTKMEFIIYTETEIGKIVVSEQHERSL